MSLGSVNGGQGPKFTTALEKLQKAEKKLHYADSIDKQISDAGTVGKFFLKIAKAFLEVINLRTTKKAEKLGLKYSEDLKERISQVENQISIATSKLGNKPTKKRLEREATFEKKEAQYKLDYQDKVQPNLDKKKQLLEEADLVKKTLIKTQSMKDTRVLKHIVLGSDNKKAAKASEAIKSEEVEKVISQMQNLTGTTDERTVSVYKTDLGSESKSVSIMSISEFIEEAEKTVSADDLSRAEKKLTDCNKKKFGFAQSQSKEEVRGELKGLSQTACSEANTQLAKIDNELNSMFGEDVLGKGSPKTRNPDYETVSTLLTKRAEVQQIGLKASSILRGLINEESKKDDVNKQNLSILNGQLNDRLKPEEHSKSTQSRKIAKLLNAALDWRLKNVPEDPF